MTPADRQPDGRQPTVVTGQQLCLLGGPMYIPYKVLGAAVRARELHGTAVYWLGANDADFEEINTVHYIDADKQLRARTWEQQTGGLSCGHVTVDKDLVQLIRTLFDELTPTEHTEELRQLALDCYREGDSLLAATRRLSAELYGDFDVTLFDPFDPAFREGTQDLLRAEARATADGRQCNVFADVDGVRRALFRDGDTFRDRDGAAVDLDQTTLLPNVRMRNVIQDAWFQTHTYVAGPGEVRYIAELGQQYDRHQVCPAAVQPRMSIYLLEPRVRRALRKLDLGLDDVIDVPGQEFVKAVAQRVAGVDQDVVEADAQAAADRLVHVLNGHGVETASLKRELQKQLKHTLGRFRKQTRERTAAQVRQAELVQRSLRPHDKPQERVLSIFYFMNLYGGTEFLAQIHAAYDFDRDQLEI